MSFSSTGKWGLANNFKTQITNCANPHRTYKLYTALLNDVRDTDRRFVFYPNETLKSFQQNTSIWEILDLIMLNW